jgi:hypothetical protein
MVSRRDSRLKGVGQGVQHVLNFTRLRPQLVERTRVIRAIVGSPSIAEGALVAKMVAGCATNLRHGCSER